MNLEDPKTTLTVAVIGIVIGLAIIATGVTTLHGILG
jgi:hypothetical protein